MGMIVNRICNGRAATFTAKAVRAKPTHARGNSGVVQRPVTLRHEIDDLSRYDFALPPELIADRPLPERDASRLMVVNRRTQTVDHHRFRDLPDLLCAGDHLVLNDTRVLPARLFGRREATGGKWEGLYLRSDEAGNWLIMGSTRGRLQPGEWIVVHPADGRSSAGLRLKLGERDDTGIWRAKPDKDALPEHLLDRFGAVPLPPYISRKHGDHDDRARYQTVFAEAAGSVAAPTAGLHFTVGLLDRCVARGVKIARVTLHVGPGTFRPISAACLDDHVMHSEFCVLNKRACDELEHTRQRGGRIIAVGTTSVRTLESAATGAGLAQFRGQTSLFIRPPWEFRAVDAMITNFHLPRSTLLVLVSALAGWELIREAYAAAIEQRYRFYSYGDAMLIL